MEKRIPNNPRAFMAHSIPPKGGLGQVLGWREDQRKNTKSELTSALMGDSAFGYNYDNIGNRLTASNNMDELTYLVNALNQYTNITDGVTITPLHDLDGNMTNYGAFAFVWDGENRLIGVASNGSDIASYKYDFMGRRYQKIVTSGSEVRTNHFIYDGWALISEIQVSSLIPQPSTNYYVYGLDLSGSLQGAGTIGGLLSATFNLGSTTYTNVYYAYDGNGNVCDLFQVSGLSLQPSLLAHYEFDPYGNTVVMTGVLADVNPFRFSSKYQDSEIGLYYYGYRYYQPTTGRWINRDPIGESGGLALYRSFSNDANSRFDFLGAFDFPGIGDVKDWITDGITGGSELLYELIQKYGNTVLSPERKSFINSMVARLKAAASSVVNIDPATMNWYDLAMAWFFELGKNPITFKGGDWTTEDLKKHEGVVEARKRALQAISQGNCNTSVGFQWKYGVDQFWKSLKDADSAATFLGTYYTKVVIKDCCRLNFLVVNTSSWESGTRLRKGSKDHPDHQGIIKSRKRNAPCVQLGGNLDQKWEWEEEL